MLRPYVQFFRKKLDESRTGEVIAEDASADTVRTKVVETVKEIAETVNLEEAQIIVSGGRGMGSKENFALVEELAEVMGGVVGATRPAIEEGWVSRAHQVGQSGKIVAPKLHRMWNLRRHPACIRHDRFRLYRSHQ